MVVVVGCVVVVVVGATVVVVVLVEVVLPVMTVQHVKVGVSYTTALVRSLPTNRSPVALTAIPPFAGLVPVASLKTRVLPAP